MRRDTAWVDGTLRRLVPLLERALPPLCPHPQQSVREALAKGEETSVWCHNHIAAFVNAVRFLFSSHH